MCLAAGEATGDGNTEGPLTGGDMGAPADGAAACGGGAVMTVGAAGGNAAWGGAAGVGARCNAD